MVIRSQGLPIADGIHNPEQVYLFQIRPRGSTWNWLEIPHQAYREMSRAHFLEQESWIQKYLPSIKQKYDCAWVFRDPQEIITALGDAFLDISETSPSG